MVVARGGARGRRRRVLGWRRAVAVGASVGGTGRRGRGDRARAAARARRGAQDPGPDPVDDAGRGAPDRVETRVVAFANDAIGRHLPSTPRSLDAVLAASRFAPRSRRAASVESRTPSWSRPACRPAGSAARSRPPPTARPWSSSATSPSSDRLDAVRRDFVANASHELKTPAATIQAAAETLRPGGGGRSRGGPSVRVAAGARGRPSVAHRRRPPRPLAARVRERPRRARVVGGRRARGRAAPRGGGRRRRGSRWRSEPRASSRSADRRGISTLLVRNLIDNAIRYSHEGDKVHVEVDSDGGRGDAARDRHGDRHPVARTSPGSSSASIGSTGLDPGRRAARGSGSRS